MGKEASRQNDELNPAAAYGARGPKGYEDPPGTNEISMKVYDDGSVTLRESLYRTKDNRIVHQKHLDGLYLAYQEGQHLPHEEAVRAGLVEPKVEKKARKPEENK